MAGEPSRLRHLLPLRPQVVVAHRFEPNWIADDYLLELANLLMVLPERLEVLPIARFPVQIQQGERCVRKAVRESEIVFYQLGRVEVLVVTTVLSEHGDVTVPRRFCPVIRDRVVGW
jgi:hypothetical protein